MNKRNQVKEEHKSLIKNYSDKFHKDIVNHEKMMDYINLHHKNTGIISFLVTPSSNDISKRDIAILCKGNIETLASAIVKECKEDQEFLKIFKSLLTAIDNKIPKSNNHDD